MPFALCTVTSGNAGRSTTRSRAGRSVGVSAITIASGSVITTSPSAFRAKKARAVLMLVSTVECGSSASIICRFSTNTCVPITCGASKRNSCPASAAISRNVSSAMSTVARLCAKAGREDRTKAIDRAGRQIYFEFIFDIQRPNGDTDSMSQCFAPCA